MLPLNSGPSPWVSNSLHIYMVNFPMNHFFSPKASKNLREVILPIHPLVLWGSYRTPVALQITSSDFLWQTGSPSDPRWSCSSRLRKVLRPLQDSAANSATCLPQTGKNFYPCPFCLLRVSGLNPSPSPTAQACLLPGQWDRGEWIWIQTLSSATS
jgi:hypothetical protein